MKLYAQMTESEKDSLMSAAVKAAYTGGKINVSDFVETEAHFVGYGGSRWLPKIGRILLVLLLALALLAASILHADASAGPPVVQGCVEDFDHHNPASNPYFSRLMSAGTVRIHKASNSFIAFVMVAECGKYLIGIWRNGVFTTSFLTSWGYVRSYIAGFAKASWNSVRMSSFLFIAVPCPGSWTEYRRPCPGGGSNQ